MSLDAEHVKLTTVGQVTIDGDGTVMVSGFKGDNCSCRDIAVLAMTHAIGVLQRSLLEHIERPGGGGNVCVG